MTTALETALVVKRDPILEALQQRLRWRTARLRTTAAHVSFIKRMLVKAQEGRITAVEQSFTSAGTAWRSAERKN